MAHNILVVDIGTQSLRASVVSSRGEILSFSQKKYDPPFYSPEKGFAEQDVDYYLEQLCRATWDIESDHPGLLSTIEGMVVVPFRDSSVILDDNKKPIRRAILWMDQRVTRIPNMSNFKWYEKAIFGLIGMTDTVKYNSERTVTFWLMEHEKENWDKMRWFCPLGAYFNYKITGRLVVSTADCIGHYPIDFPHGKWFSRHHLKQNVFKIPYESLPELVKAGEVIGQVTDEFSQLSGIPAGTRVFASGSDKSCETFGNGCIDKYSASISLGTACSIDIVDTKYAEPEKFLPSYPCPYPGAFDQEIQIYNGLWMVKWFIENFGHEDQLEARAKGVTTEEILNEKLKSVPAGCDGLVLQPYWQPGLKRPNAKGSIVGFSAVHGKYHLYRAIIEGIAFALREGMDEIVKKTHTKPSFITISGGGSASKEFCQIIADVFNIECYISPEKESSTIGGAMSGFLACGVFTSPQEAKDAMVMRGESVHPNAKNHEIYNKLYKKVYLKMYPSLKKVYENSKSFFLDSVEGKQ